MTNEKKSKKYCTSCGSKIDYADEKCPNCNKKFNMKYCTNCGSIMAHNVKNCPDCGEICEDYNSPIFSKGLFSSSSSILAIIAVIIGLIIAFIVYFLFLVVNNPSSQIVASQLTLQVVIIVLASLFGVCGIIISDIYPKIAAVQYIICAIGLFFGGIILLLVPMVLFLVAAFLEYRRGES